MKEEGIIPIDTAEGQELRGQHQGKEDRCREQCPAHRHSSAHGIGGQQRLEPPPRVRPNQGGDDLAAATLQGLKPESAALIRPGGEGEFFLLDQDGPTTYLLARRRHHELRLSAERQDLIQQDRETIGRHRSGHGETRLIGGLQLHRQPLQHGAFQPGKLPIAQRHGEVPAELIDRVHLLRHQVEEMQAAAVAADAVRAGGMRESIS